MKPFFFAESEIVIPKRKRKDSTRRDCTTCGMYTGCQSPRMIPYGRNELGIVIVGEAPGKTEDERGRPFVGESGELLRKCLRANRIDMDRDCLVTNVIQCRPPNNRNPSPPEIDACRSRLVAQVKEARPQLILALGSCAIQEMLPDAPVSLGAERMHGRIIPNYYWNCPVACSYHPAFFVRVGNDKGDMLSDVIATSLKALDTEFTDTRLDEDQYHIVEDMAAVKVLLDRVQAGREIVFLDYETTGLNMFATGFQLLTVGFAFGESEAWVTPLAHPQARWSKAELTQIYKLLGTALAAKAPKVIQNWQFEDLCSRRVLGINLGNVVWDTLVAEHILDNRAAITSQEFQTYVRYGTVYKSDVDASRLEHTPLDRVCRYNTLDCRYLARWYTDQQQEMTPDLLRAYKMFHRATPCMATLTERGIRVDTDAMASLRQNVVAELDGFAETKRTAKVVERFRTKYSKEWNSASNKDKQRLFFDILKFEPLRATKTGQSVDAATMKYLLAQAGEGEAADLIRICQREASLNKLLGTYIDGLTKQLDNRNLLHPSFLLHRVRTYRSSSANPNFQNIPYRLPDMARVRKTMVPQHDVFVEADYASAEVRVLAMYARDKTLIKWIRDNVDFHRKYGAKLYGVSEAELTNEQRFDTKNSFTFPTFYGSYWKNTSKSIAEWTEERTRRVEEQMWKELSGVKRWQDETLRWYDKHGYIQTKLGFRMRGPIERNKVLNYLIQSTAFHRLLIAVMDIEEAMRGAGMQSILVGQIHDSLVVDCTLDEVEAVLDIIDENMTRRIWDWDCSIPMEVEFSMGKNFLDMKPI